MTAFVILTSVKLNTAVDATGAKITGAALTQLAYSTVFGKGGDIFIAICLFFFAFSTIIGWYFFGQANIKYLFGPGAVKIYAGVVAVCIFLGSLAEVDIVWNLADCFNAFMVVPNIIALFALTNVVKQVHKDYFENFKNKKK